MDQKLERIRQLEEQAHQAATLAEGQALTAEADRLRSGRRGEMPGAGAVQPIFRN
jgi:hypothetical protein